MVVNELRCNLVINVVKPIIDLTLANVFGFIDSEKNIADKMKQYLLSF